MRITYYGHAAFLVEAVDGTRVIIDPYLSGAFGGAFRYAPIDEPADLVLATHEHDDHGAVDTIPGHPQIRVHPTAVTMGAVTITGVRAAHDSAGGKKRGANTLIVVDDGYIRLCHLGDLGHVLDDPSRKALGRIDVLMIPIGGTYTIDASTAVKVAASLSPRVVVPMHYKTPVVDLPLTSVDDFTVLAEAAGMHVRRLGSSVQIEPAGLPPSTEVFVLDRSR
jgi:L-ascorbate metabolism protein UlaG (beta-lactamase superfamily)